MDSKIVNKEIRSKIWPCLREAGFTRFTPRAAWRNTSSRIDAVNFQSFNWTLARGLGCTTFSFGLSLGCHFPAIPESHPLKRKGEVTFPEGYHCHMRRHLRKTLAQKELPRSDIWFIDPDGIYLRETIGDARSVILAEGLPWFNRWADIREVLRTLIEDEETNDGTFGFGANPSPIRSYMVGYLALHLGLQDLARSHLIRALESGCFEAVNGAIADSLRLINGKH